MRLAARALALEIHRLLFRPIYEVMPIRCWLNPMINMARQWEERVEMQAAQGVAGDAPPFSVSVMDFLRRMNESRNAAYRRHAARMRAHHVQAAERQRRQEEKRPHVSRRVLRERRQRSTERIEERRSAAREDAGGAAEGDVTTPGDDER